MKTVLVIDDEYGIVEVVVLALKDEGYRVITAADGQQGLERLAETRPDLVLLDFMMPRMDGPAVAKAMRANRAHREIPIVMMSAVGEAAVRERFSGYAAFLRKPFRVRTVLDLVTRLIGPGAEEAKGG
jgi:CheY-like chemotaxis protein